MKCPCCGSQTDAEMIVLHNTIYMSDGIKHRIPVGAARLLKSFLNGEMVRRPLRGTNSSTQDVYLSNLREVISDLGLPFKIVYVASSRSYKLERNRA